MLTKDGKVESSFEIKSSPIGNTRKMRKNDIPSKISILEHDSFLKMKNKSQSLLEYILSYNISKIGRKTINIYGDTVKFATVDVFVRATLYNN